MVVTLSLTPELHAQLERQARASGKEVTSYIADTLETVASANPTGISAVSDREELDDWLARFDDWARRRKTYNPNFDDRRDSIYSDRA